MDDQNKNLILATALSFAVILVWFLLFPPQDTPQTTTPPATATATMVAPGTAIVAPGAAATAGSPAAAIATAAADLPRLQIDTPRLSGAISVQGGRIDDLLLKGYPETLAKGSPLVRLLSPVGEPNAYYVLYGWAPGGSLADTDVPGANTIWSVASGNTLTPATPASPTW